MPRSGRRSYMRRGIIAVARSSTFSHGEDQNASCPTRRRARSATVILSELGTGRLPSVYVHGHATGVLQPREPLRSREGPEPEDVGRGEADFGSGGPSERALRQAGLHSRRQDEDRGGPDEAGPRQEGRRRQVCPLASEPRQAAAAKGERSSRGRGQRSRGLDRVGRADDRGGRRGRDEKYRPGGRDVKADVMTTIEVDNRVALNRFNKQLLPAVGAVPYPHVMVIDGNDDRGIDVGLVSRFPIATMRSHVDDLVAGTLVFSRDCPEYEIKLPAGGSLVVLANHSKSKGFGSQADSNARRLKQAKRVREIYEARKQEGATLIAG